MPEEHIKIGKVSQSEADKADKEYKKLKKEFKARYKVKNKLRKNYAYINSQYINYSKAFAILEQFDQDKEDAITRLSSIADPTTKAALTATLTYDPVAMNAYQDMIDSITSKNNRDQITTDLKSIKINISTQTSTPPYDVFIQNAQTLERKMKQMDRTVAACNARYGLTLTCNNASILTPEKKKDKYVDTYMDAKGIANNPKNRKKIARKAKHLEKHYRKSKAFASAYKKNFGPKDYDMGDER